MYEWDETKRAENRRKHGVDFAIVEEFDWDRQLFSRTSESDIASSGGSHSGRSARRFTPWSMSNATKTSSE